MDSFTGHETMIREPEFPAGAQHGVFSFNLNGFNVSQITRESVRTLRALLFPELLATAQERETAEQKAAIITPRWVEAQLYHYGFVYPPDADPSRAKAQLLDMVARGLVSHPQREHYPRLILSIVRSSAVPNFCNQGPT